MGISEWLGLKKREPVICAECKFHEVKTREIVTLEKKHYIHYHICRFKHIESIDFISGEKTTIDIECKSFNAKGNCRHFIEAEWVHPEIKSECAECTEYISPYCNLWDAGTTFAGTEQKINKPRSVLNADGKCVSFIPSFVDSE